MTDSRSDINKIEEATANTIAAHERLVATGEDEVRALKELVLMLFSALKGIEHHAQEIVIDCCAEIQEGADSPDVHACLSNWQAVLVAIKKVEG